MAKPNKKLAQEHKEKGNQFFAQEKYSESIVWYSKAIDADPTDHVLHSNKSAAYLNEENE
jgi:stress-induced-phosphoprotein 1